MLISSQLTLINKCQQQGGGGVTSYQKLLTNDSARVERRNIGVWAHVKEIRATLAPGPTALHGVILWPLSWLPVRPCSLYPECLPCSRLTVPTICQAHCAHHGCCCFHAYHTHNYHPPSLFTISSVLQSPKIHQCFHIYATNHACQNNQSTSFSYPTGLLVKPKLPSSPCSPYLLCMLCCTPAQEASLLAQQTEGMCLPCD